jgi:glycosyltransferase involved in cell wall biosynthesis
MLRVSVIVPAYNAEATIARAVASALAQTESALEVLVIDDASADGTAALVMRLAQQDARVRLLRSTVNGGPGAARNVGFAAARGTWIALLDADDTFAPTRLEMLLALADRHDADMVSDNILLCAEAGDAPPHPMLSARMLAAPKLMSPSAFVRGNFGGGARVSYGFMQPLIRRDFLERHAIRYDARNRFGEDYMLGLTCLLAGAKWWITPEPLYRYMLRSGSLTEVQTAADLHRLRQFIAARLHDDAGVAADPQLARALRRHQAVIDRCYYYRAFTDAVKARRFAEAMRLLLATPNSFRHIVAESLAQAPVIAAKALRGGYSRGAMHRLVSTQHGE